jgi:hypothetical protein
MNERCEASLIEFFACAWPQFDPAPVKINWHHEVIAKHLEAVTRARNPQAADLGAAALL